MTARDAMRCFSAIRLNDEVRAALTRVQRKLAGTDVPVRWVPPANLHLTLVFYGDISATKAKLLAADMEQASEGVLPFDLELYQLGCFGPVTAPRVVWVGVRETPAELRKLYNDLRDSARDHGLDVDERDYTAHITLGRGQRRRHSAALTLPLDSYRNVSFGNMTVSSISLMRSERLDGGVRYEELYKAVLKGR